MKTLYSPQAGKLCNWLQEQREAKGLTMREAGEMLGKPHTFIAKTESGERRLDVIEYIWYCQTLGFDAISGICKLIDDKV